MKSSAPPGRRTRRISRNEVACSGTEHSTRVDTTVSKVASSKGR